ncbi:MAG: c-type cytochrome [Bryobacteraceae bacterium]
MRTSLWLALLSIAIGPSAPGQEHGQPGRGQNSGAPVLPTDQESLEAGRKLYATACSGCHGRNGEGGRGPKISEGRQIQRMPDQRLIEIILKGVPGTDMPGFPFKEDQAALIAAQVRSFAAPAFRTPIKGDPVEGERIFFGKGECSNCHMIRGKGGFLGPDLSNVGMRRTARLLEEALLNPDARLADGFQGATATLASGKTVTGAVKNNTNYWIHILDSNGMLHRLPKTEVKALSFHEASLMPSGYGKRLSPEELNNVLAFLSRQASRRN